MSSAASSALMWFPAKQKRSAFVLMLQFARLTTLPTGREAKKRSIDFSNLSRIHVSFVIKNPQAEFPSTYLALYPGTGPWISFNLIPNFLRVLKPLGKQFTKASSL